MSGSTDLNPCTVETTTGKKPSRNAEITFGNMPKPNQTTNSGAMAIFGIALREHQQRIDVAFDRARVGDQHGAIGMPNAAESSEARRASLRGRPSLAPAASAIPATGS